MGQAPEIPGSSGRAQGVLLLTKKKGGTAAVKIRGTRLALGRKLAEAIEILPLEEPAAEWKERRRQTVEESE